MPRGCRATNRLVRAIVSVAVIALAGAAPAVADTTIGHAAGNQLCFGGFVAADPGYSVPTGGGVITSFSYGNDGHNAGAQLDFEVLRPNGDGSYTVAGHTGLQTLAGNSGLQTFPAHIAVSGGEVLGYYETGTDNCLEMGTLDSVLAEQVGSDPTTGATLALSSGFPIQGASLNEAANLAPVASPAELIAAGNTVSIAEGQPLAGAVATFSDADAQPPSAYGATINWGDGSSAAGSVTATGTGQYEVAGPHTYAEAGDYPVSVAITDGDGTSATVTGTAAVSDAKLSVSGMASPTVPAATLASFSGALAAVTDGNLSGSAGDLTATIDWGDGTSSGGLVTGSGGAYTVSGSHSYAADGPYAVAVQVADREGSVASATTGLLVYETADQSGGSFVVGDAAVGATVYFWGSQWASQNPLSGGGAPTSFKGFGSSSTGGCGAILSARPGRSAPPPDAIPPYMAVAVTGSISKSGPVLSGVIEKVVVVQTDSGYGPDPGTPGTGSVVATVCG